ncbi:MAG TPA: DUF6585 family protein [Candidatus Angelobacter sp.]|nr:DUF6585 family protein [Candidatus Angelobacter sp.]
MFPSPAERTFKDTVLWRMVAAIPFLGLLAWGVYDYSDNHRFDPVLWSAVAVAGLVCAYAFIWAAARRITFHAEGLSYKSLVSDIDLPWTSITETRYSQQQINMGAHFGLIGVLLSAAASKGDSGQMFRTLEVVGQRKITFNSNIRNVAEAMQLVLQKVNPRIREQAERMLSSGGTVAFGNVSLSPQGVIWKGKQPIPYNSIVKYRLDGPSLKIKSDGKWLNDISVNAKKVPNVFVLLDMIEQRRTALGSMTAAAMAGSSAGRYL